MSNKNTNFKILKDKKISGSNNKKRVTNNDLLMAINNINKKLDRHEQLFKEHGWIK